MPDGIIKVLLIVGSGLSMVKICADIRDRFFMEKLKCFIDNIEKNTKWKEKIGDIKECSKISKRLLYIVDSCNADNKLKLIGRAFNYLVNGDISKDEYFYTINMISKSFYPNLKMLLDIDESDKRFTNDGTKYNYEGMAHLLNIGALDYDGQTQMLINEQTNEVESRPCMIVTLNGYGKLIRRLLSALNKRNIACLE